MTRIVHLGFGNFHRAHQAWYTQRANDLTGRPWHITGVSMSRRDLALALAPSDGAYTLGLRGADGITTERISVHDRLLVARDQPDAVVAEIADPATQIVTLTITEKGYAVGGAHRQGAFDLLVRGLARRADRDAPITVMSCDNLSGNGGVTAQLLAQAAETHGYDIADYLDRSVTCPDTMVDRITPYVTQEMAAEITAAAGRSDPAPVMTETFTEWVIEDRFAAARPDWDAAGAVFAPDIAPFETRKLLFLNAAHSLLAYTGLLKRHTFVHEATADPDLNATMTRLWSEAAPALPEELAENLPAYLDALRARFAVPGMKHRLDQIAADGSLKLPVRIAPIIAAGHASGRATPAARSAVAAWIAYILHHGPRGTASPDPKLADLLPRLDPADVDASVRVACAVIGVTLGAAELSDLSSQVRRHLAG